MKLKKIIRYSTQVISKDDVSSVSKALKSSFITEGPLINNFEKKLTNYTKSKYATIVNSASSALIIACGALGLKKNDFLWTSPISFVSSANCAFFYNAKVDFVDINQNSFNLDVNQLELKLSKAKKQKKLPKIIVVVHLGGNPCDMKKIKRLSKKYKFSVIEDASHALGANYKNIKIGNPKYSDLSILSFHPVKMITTGEGGALMSNDYNLDKKIKSLRSHGIVREKKYLVNKKLPKWYYEQKYLSSNYRMTAFQAALGISQLKKIDKFTKERNNLAGIYEKKLKKLNIKFQLIDKNNKSSRHLFIILVDKKIRNKLYFYLEKNKIQTNLHYIPIYRHPYYKKFRFNKKNYKNSERYYEEALSIPLHCNISRKEQNYVINKIEYFLMINKR